MSGQQDPRTSRRLRSRLLDPLHRRPVRDLQIERLESRVVLSVLPAVEAPSADSPAAAVAETSGTVELANSVSVIDAETIDLVVAQSASDASITADTSGVTSATDLASSGVGLVADTAAGGSAAPTVPTGGGHTPGESGQPLLPPIIIEFDVAFEGQSWLFSGRVLDDKDVTGLTVHFGGLLAGYSATVGEDGFFEFVSLLGPEASGTVSAYTIDSDSLRSETVSLWIG